MSSKEFIDPIGEGVVAFYENNDTEPILVSMDQAENEELHPSYFFRSILEMPKIETIGMQWSKGKVLDVGCGAGSHALALQQKGNEVKAIDISAKCCQVARLRGVQDCEAGDFFTFNNGKYDTVLMLMNGIGIAGTIDRAKDLLNHAKSLLNPGGSIIFDSSDIIYLFMDEDGGVDIDIAADRYYGQISYQLTYKGRKAKPFDWLFLDPDNMRQIAEECGLKVKRLHEGDHYDYICELTM